MTPENNACPEGKGKETERRQDRVSSKAPEEVASETLHEPSDGEDDHSSENQLRMVLDVPYRSANRTHDSDDSHHKDLQVATKKRQADALAPDDRFRKAVKYQNVAATDSVNEANDVTTNVQTMDINSWHGSKIAEPLLCGRGYLAKLNDSRDEGRILQKIFIDPGAKQNLKGGVITYTNPVLETNLELDDRDVIGGQKTDVSPLGKYLGKKKSETAMHTQPVTQPHQQVVSPSRTVNEETEQSSENGDEEAANTAHEAPYSSPMMESETDRCLDWQELLDFMELTKSRLLENELALKFLRSLEPRIMHESNQCLQLHALCIRLAKMANISQRRERFEEYLVEATREWYCLATVCKYGYDDENALAIEDGCPCLETHNTCVKVRIRRGKLGALDVRFG